ncbi:MAG: hypothetical protein JWO47_927 [Candidatus Saccharibacteria bacterium]|nr:hypothetical protein [Candidatus Saccharibacteria bacterium]
MQATAAIIKFEAKPIEINGWVVLRLTDSASKQLPSRSQVMVKGTINDFEFIAPLEPDGNFGHWLHIDNSMQKSAGITVGETAELEIESVKNWPEPEIPKDVQKGIVDNPETHDLWARVTPMSRWEWLRWINSTNNMETREKRIEVSCSKLLNGLRRPCCFNRSMCCIPDVSKSGVLIGAKS